ncbi:YkgJ family cysteine cluster protein [Halorientalis pallida]|uniref:YkgJ family cysteine cluster protein n=1 Tax=Halorientalis pallida TaxID=2479928 RepID=A0A498KZK9_9EURY|nr:YkgJ family cysteine cluster protein [Halorientalis pallida]RXK48626.1 YkgJ family cysteine cluster protein [Halorientalis pallida]
MESLEAELDRARDLDVPDLADAIVEIGFECTRCGACCKAETCENGDSDDVDPEPHTATVFPDEIRRVQDAGDEEYDFRDVARPMPYGLEDGPEGPEGETFEWALQTDDCGDCTFYEEREASETPHGDGEAVEDAGTGACTVHEDRPLICRTYPFSVALGGTSQPMGEAVDEHGMVRAHECEGLGRDISRAEATDLAAALKERAVREIEEAIAVRDAYEPVETGPGEIVVHDSEGQKRPDGTGLD